MDYNKHHYLYHKFYLSIYSLFLPINLYNSHHFFKIKDLHLYILFKKDHYLLFGYNYKACLLIFRFFNTLFLGTSFCNSMVHYPHLIFCCFLIHLLLCFHFIYFFSYFFILLVFISIFIVVFYVSYNDSLLLKKLLLIILLI